MQVSHLKRWLMESYPAETSNVPPNRTWWIKLVYTIQLMWDNRPIQTKLGRTVLVLIPKANADNGGIRMLEIVWKVVEAVIDTQIKAVVQFHDVLHGF